MSKKDSRYFQWIAGDKKDQICIFEKVVEEDGVIYIVFTDKSRINEALVAPLNFRDLTGKYMAEIDHPTNKWVYKEEWVGRQDEIWELNAEGERVCVQPFIQGKKVVKWLPPKPSAPRSSNFGVINYSEAAKEVEKQKAKVDESDPVYILISKCKKEDSEISMGISVSLPPKSLYDIAKQSFDKGNEKFIDYIIDDLSVDEIKNALKIAIAEMYEKTS